MSAAEDRTCSLVEGCERPETSGGGCLKHKFEDGVRVNGIALFQHDRRIGVTQAQKAREMFEDSRRDGKQIAAVRGRRRAHEKMNAGRWQKV